jgi:hypothetical protein
MHTYWLLGPTQTYLSLLEATRNRAVTISDLQTVNQEEPLILTPNTATSVILKVSKLTFDDGDLGGPMLPLTQTSSPTKSNTLNKMKEKQLTCSFSGADLL